MSSDNRVGAIGWVDLTVPNAELVRAFYQDVVGWESTPVEMGGYQDHCMIPPGSSQPVAGICHAKGANSAIPPVWLVYLHVADLDQSLVRCENAGGTIVAPQRTLEGYGRMAVIKDPAGAICALFEARQAP